MRTYRTLDDVTVEYFVYHPEEIEPFLNESFAEYAVDGDSHCAFLDTVGQ